MNTSSILTRSDFDAFLSSVRFKYMTDSNLLVRCIRAAYLDFSRTLHGFRRLPSREILRSQTRKYLQNRLVEIQTEQITIGDQQGFDIWHRTTCRELKKLWGDNGYKSFHIGQAQKWINMTFKYIFTLGENQLPGFTHLYHLCHIPLDRKIIDNLQQFTPPKLSKPWSRLCNYEEYIIYQKWIRESFSIVPLDVEFIAWPGKSVDAFFNPK